MINHKVISMKYTYITISLGGSVINPGVIDVQFLKNFRDLIVEEIIKSNKQLRVIIVCGGGAVARQYIEAKPPDLPQGQADYLGIIPTWVNAQLITAWFHTYCAPIPSQEFSKFLDHAQLYPVVVSGGFLPALKTDEDAAIAADYFGSPYLINITNVNGIYDNDPKKNVNAKKIDFLTYKEFYAMFDGHSIAPGASSPFTVVSAKICERSKCRIFVVNKDMAAIKEAIRGNCIGTEVGP